MRRLVDLVIHRCQLNCLGSAIGVCEERHDKYSEVVSEPARQSANTLFEIMVAMTCDDKKHFDLAEKYEDLIDGTDEDDNCLTKAKFETIPETTVMQAVAAITTGSIRAKDILKIKRDDFINHWEP